MKVTEQENWSVVRIFQLCFILSWKTFVLFLVLCDICNTNDGVKFLVANVFFTDRWKKFKTGKNEKMPKCKDLAAISYLNIFCL